LLVLLSSFLRSPHHLQQNNLTVSYGPQCARGEGIVMWKDDMHCALRSDPEGSTKTATMAVARVIDSSSSTGTRRRHMMN
jgi:hypothetical protein